MLEVEKNCENVLQNDKDKTLHVAYKVTHILGSQLDYCRENNTINLKI